MTLAVQFQTFLAMVMAGSAIAIQLDIYHRCIPVKKRSKWTVFVFDLCFWIVQALLVFSLLFFMNDGDLRIYIFLAILLGFIIYWQTVRPLFLHLLEIIIKIIRAITNIVMKIIYILLLAPVIWLLKGIKRSCMIVLTSGKWVLHQFLAFLFFLIRPVFEAIGGPRHVQRIQNGLIRLRNWFQGKDDDEDRR